LGIVLGRSAVVLVLLGPAIFQPRREPFNRLMEFLELVMGRARVGWSLPPAL
jgi:hypothetical protein